MRYAVAIGSNIGEACQYFDRARGIIKPLVDVVAESTLLMTEPVGGPAGQGVFTNGCWIVETLLGPHQLLLQLQKAERACGRTREIHWGPRTLDLDLLLAEDCRIEVHSPILDMPHPRMRERDFVMIPLREVATGWRDWI